MESSQIGKPAGDEARLWERTLVAVIAVLVALTVLRLGGWWLGLAVGALAALGTLEVYRIGALALGVTGVPRLAGAVTAALLPLAAVRADGFAEFAPVAFSLIAALTLISLVRAVAGGLPAAPGLGGASLTVLGVLWVGAPFALGLLLHGLPVDAGWNASGRAVVDGAGDGGSARSTWLFGSAEAWSGLVVLLFPLGATWISDTAAFFGGRRFGRRKLAPRLSPDKTWEGSFSGMAGALAAALGWGWLCAPLLPGLEIEIWAVALAGAVTGVMIQLGDLTESVFKREAGVKDSGTFFRAHGGVLDRVDSLLFSLPTGYLCFVAFEWL